MKYSYRMRPVVSYVRLPAHKLCKYTVIQPKATIEKSLEFIDKIKSVESFPFTKSVSFDVKAFYFNYN